MSLIKANSLVGGNIFIFIYLIKYETIQTYALTYIFAIGRGKKPILYVVANS